MLTFIMLGIYVLLLIYIGYKDHKTEDRDGFIIGNRDIGFLGTLASTSTSLRNGGGLFLWVGLGFTAGYKLYSLFLGIIIGFFILSLLAPRVRKISRIRNYITMPQMVRDNIGVKTEKITALIALCFSILIMTVEFYVLGNILHLITGIGEFNSILVFAGIVALYTCLGGYKTIIKTDILQLFVILSMWLFVFFIPPNIGDAFNTSSMISSITTTEFVFSLLWGMILIFCYSEFWQRIFSARDEKSASQGIKLAGVILLIFSIPLTLMGMSAKEFISIDTNSQETFIVILNSGIYPLFFMGLLALVGVASSMSTLDTNVYVFSSTLLEDILDIKVNMNKKKYIFLSRICIFVLLLICSILALHVKDVVKYMLNVITITTVLSPLFILVGTGWLKHKSKKLDKYFMWSLIISFAIGVYIFIQGYMNTYLIRVSIPALSTVLLTFSYYLYRRKHVQCKYTRRR